jgi:hemoglobin-like flavoprotein
MEFRHPVHGGPMTEKDVQLNENDIQLFNDSLERCTAKPEFLSRFYDLFVGSSPEIAAKFKSTDFQRQRRMLKASLYLLIYAVEGKPEGLVHLERMAEIHGKGRLGIPAWMYDTWFECLLTAVRESDSRFSPETEAAWQNVLREGIDFMKSRSL